MRIPLSHGIRRRVGSMSRTSSAPTASNNVRNSSFTNWPVLSAARELADGTQRQLQEVIYTPDAAFVNSWVISRACIVLEVMRGEWLFRYIATSFGSEESLRPQWIRI